MAHVTLYTKSYCPFCHRAKALLDEYQVTYEEIPVDGDEETYAAIKAKTGQHTVPQIFIHDTFIGGCDELFALEESGELQQKLSS